MANYYEEGSFLSDLEKARDIGDSLEWYCHSSDIKLRLYSVFAKPFIKRLKFKTHYDVVYSRKQIADLFKEIFFFIDYTLREDRNRWIKDNDDRLEIIKFRKEFSNLIEGNFDDDYIRKYGLRYFLN